MRSSHLNVLLAAAAAILSTAAPAAPAAPRPVVHRHTPNSKRGRQMISPGKEFFAHNVPKEQAEWNRQVDEAKAAKKAANSQKRNGAVWKEETTFSAVPTAPPSVHTGGKTLAQAARRREVTGTTDNGSSTG